MSKLQIAILLLCSQFFLACGGSDSPIAPPSSQSDTVEVNVYSDDADVAEPAIAAAPDGGVYVLYIEHHADKSSDVYFQRVDSSLKLDGERVRVNKIGGEVKTWAGDPPTIVAAGNGTVYVGWTRKVKSAEGSGTDLMLSVSRDRGKTFADPVKVNDDTLPASHGMHSLATGKNGEIFMAWLDERSLQTRESAADDPRASRGYSVIRAHHVPGDNSKHQTHKVEAEEAAEPNSEVYFAVSRDGGKTFSANKRVADEVCPCCKTSMAVADDGTLYLSWRQVLPGSLRHIAVSSTNDGGASFAEPTIVSDDQWQLNACPVSGAALVAGPGEKLSVAWYTAGKAGQPGVYLAESVDNGRSFGPRTLLSSDAASGTPVLLSMYGGKYLLSVFEAVNESVQFVSKPAGLSVEGFVPIQAGMLPAAASVKGSTVVAYVKSDSKGRSVWLRPFTSKH